MPTIDDLKRMLKTPGVTITRTRSWNVDTDEVPLEGHRMKLGQPYEPFLVTAHGVELEHGAVWFETEDWWMFEWEGEALIAVRKVPFGRLATAYRIEDRDALEVGPLAPDPIEHTDIVAEGDGSLT